MPEFAGQGPLVEWHIKSEHSREMAEKSIIVCMCLVLQIIKKFVNSGTIRYSAEE